MLSITTFVLVPPRSVTEFKLRMQSSTDQYLRLLLSANVRVFLSVSIARRAGSFRGRARAVGRILAGLGGRILTEVRAAVRPSVSKTRFAHIGTTAVAQW